MEGNPWFLVIGASIGAIPGVLAYLLGRRKHVDEQDAQEKVSAISGFVDLVKALEERLDRSNEELDRVHEIHQRDRKESDEALGRCRQELERMRRTLLAFEHGGILPEEDK